jgi:hypothetical protein
MFVLTIVVRGMRECARSRGRSKPRLRNPRKKFGHDFRVRTLLPPGTGCTPNTGCARSAPLFSSAVSKKGRDTKVQNVVLLRAFSAIEISQEFAELAAAYWLLASGSLRLRRSRIRVFRVLRGETLLQAPN